MCRVRTQNKRPARVAAERLKFLRGSIYLNRYALVLQHVLPLKPQVKFRLKPNERRRMKSQPTSVLLWGLKPNFVSLTFLLIE